MKLKSPVIGGLAGGAVALHRIDENGKAVTADVIQILWIQRVVAAEAWLSKEQGIESLKNGLTTERSS